MSAHCPDPANMCSACRGYARALDQAMLLLDEFESIQEMFEPNQGEFTEAEPEP
jgi:hypothetical protein